jgi:hypothetical protein
MSSLSTRQLPDYPMINITNIIKKAISSEVAWSIGPFYDFVKCIEKTGLKVVFSNEADDLWVAVVADDALIARVWKKYPLMFARADHVKSIRAVTEEEFNYVHIIALDDLSENILCMDVDKDMMDRIHLSFDQNSFSADDFWSANCS